MAKMVELTLTSSSRSGLRSARHILYRKPALKTKFGEQAFSNAGPAACNSLLDYIQSESNTKHQETSQNLPVYIVILNSFILSNTKCPPVYFVGGR